MSSDAHATRLRSARELVVPFVIGLLAAAIPLIQDGSARWVFAGVVLSGLALCAISLRPNRWLYLFFVCDLLLPPLSGTSEGGGIHVAAAVAVLGLFAGAVQMPRWRSPNTRLSFAFGAFTFCLIGSAPFAAIYSGEEIAAASLARIALFLIGGYVFAYALSGPRDPADNVLKFAAFLFIIAIIAAAFACLDFYFHFPAPAGFSDQYVWLLEGVFRRAQGLFYDAGTLGNFCAFSLIYCLISLFERPGRGHPPRIAVWAGAAVLAAALILSYSRASVCNVAIAMLAYACLRDAGLRKTFTGIALAGGIAAMAVHFVFPSFAANYWSRFEATFRFISERPDGVLSGRLTNWRRLFEFIGAHPWQTMFGIGYKTLPYTTHLGDPVIADNTYLSLLVETGVAGLGSFLLLLSGILKTSLRAARSLSPRAAFLGKWAFCFWCGETAQMLSGDLLTYWRVLPVYFWVLGSALREAGAVE